MTVTRTVGGNFSLRVGMASGGAIMASNMSDRGYGSLQWGGAGSNFTFPKQLLLSYLPSEMLHRSDITMWGVQLLHVMVGTGRYITLNMPIFSRFT